ncbi:transcriptional regulator [Rhodoferax sp. AJA081-3]|uniref:helix-turn-helix transcriptional regulator n=1 Tax=Rhodoferax sp. AJA081-3 TaxID=2752316 RepID=UPI001AE0B4D3|nr:metalloregulator ArsR/SmtB family transcription factor [Rhodoferax sp. AJA081-3]QTN29128.1 transcriptional regulator [Rhodoferax sp. AJA081-3]
MNTSDHILFLLKTRGPSTAQQLAEQLQLTSMAVRRHLEQGQEKGLLLTEDRADKVGRPARYWLLSEAGHARFPDRHSELTVQLIAQVRTLFGEDGLDKLITAREQVSEASYATHMAGSKTLSQKVAKLVEARDAEGYMAEMEKQADGSFLLVENHCPICAAATECQGFCKSELDVFRRTLGPGSTVERVEHALAGARRCVYRITPV